MSTLLVIAVAIDLLESGDDVPASGARSEAAEETTQVVGGKADEAASREYSYGPTGYGSAMRAVR